MAFARLGKMFSRLKNFLTNHFLSKLEQISLNGCFPLIYFCLETVLKARNFKELIDDLSVSIVGCKCENLIQQGWIEFSLNGWLKCF